jgi:hypothetical protein
MSFTNVTPPSPETIVVNGIPIPVQSVELIVGHSGISLGGGEMVIWKRNVVRAAGKRYVSATIAEQNERDFNQWVAACPSAVGVRPNGSIALPRIDPRSSEDPLQILGNSLAAVKRELGSQVLRGLAFSALFFLGGMALIIVIVAYNIQHPNDMTGFKMGVLGLVLVVCAFLVGGMALRLFFRQRRIERVLRDLMDRGEINASLLAEVLAPTPAAAPPTSVSAAPSSSATVARSPHAAAPSPKVTLVPATLAILSLCTALCPFVGLVLAVIALALTFRQSSWARTVSIIAAILNALFSAFVIVMAVFGG